MTATLQVLPLPGPKFGARLLRERKLRKMTQTELAAASGLSSVSIRSYEHGRRSPTDGSLLALDAALNRYPVQLDWAPAPKPVPKQGPNAPYMDDAYDAMRAMPAEAAELVARFAAFVMRGEAAYAGMLAAK